MWNRALTDVGRMTVSSLYGTDISALNAKDSAPDALVFNRIVSLKSSFKLPK